MRYLINKKSPDRRMKDIVSEKEAEIINDTDCALCVTHERAYKKISDGIVCPYCGHNHKNIEIKDYTVVGMANYYDPDHKIGKFPVFQCEKCTEFFALMPEKIFWNTNHDVYFTGGGDYLQDEDETEIFSIAQSKIKASLRQWVERYEKGEKLDPSYPALWIKRDITHAIASYLFEKGLKK